MICRSTRISWRYAFMNNLTINAHLNANGQRLKRGKNVFLHLFKGMAPQIIVLLHRLPVTEYG